MRAIRALLWTITLLVIALYVLLVTVSPAQTKKPKQPCPKPVSGQCAVIDNSFACGFRWGACTPAQHIVLKGLPPFTMVHVAGCGDQHEMLAIYSDGEMTLPWANPVESTGDGAAYFYLPSSDCMEIRLDYGQPWDKP